jgi:hypothetical protein
MKLRLEWVAGHGWWMMGRHERSGTRANKAPQHLTFALWKNKSRARWGRWVVQRSDVRPTAESDADEKPHQRSRTASSLEAG